MGDGNVCGWMTHGETERREGRKRRRRGSVFLRLFPLLFSLRTWAPFVSFTPVSILCWELFMSLSVSCFSFSRQGNTDAELIQGERGRWRKRRTTSIFESFLPAVTVPYLHHRVLNAVQSPSSAKPNLSRHLRCDLALLGKVKFVISLRVFAPSKPDPWHVPLWPRALLLWPTTAASPACGRPLTGQKHPSARPP